MDLQALRENSVTIDRSHFLPSHVLNGDFPVPLSETCSVPSERMAYLLAGLLETRGNVLEIGTGSGYQAAVLSEMCASVTSIEANPLPGVAEKLPANVYLICADGLFFDTEQEWDGILATFAVDAIPEVWTRQLKEGAKLVVPLQVGKNSCRISVYTRCGDELHLNKVCAYAPFTEAVHTSH